MRKAGGYLVSLLAACFLTACALQPNPTPPVKPDPAAELWYSQLTAQLSALNSRATVLLNHGKPDEAAELIKQAQPLSDRLLAVPRPTLAAMEAASDLDRLYARMLLANRHYEWARMLFQKDLSRWTHWSPQTAGTAARKQQAEASLAECDRALARSKTEQ